MLELLIIPAMLGAGLAWGLLAPEEDDPPEPPLSIDLGDDVADFDGTDAKEHVTANALDNTLRGGGNNDLLSGVDGNDTLLGEDGNDRLFGGEGADRALGGPGNDRLFLGDGDDVAVGGDTNDLGDDFIRGGAGNDHITDTQGSNQIFGDLGHDEIWTADRLGATGSDGPSAPDTVDAGYGNDTLIGDDGDVLTGGLGEDKFIIALPSFAEDAPVVLTDFDLRDDLFSVVFLEETPQDPTVYFEHDSAFDVLRATVDGREVATISGLGAGDIPFLRTFVTTLPELMAGQP